MNIIDINDAHINREYELMQTMERKRLEEFHAMLELHPHRGAILDAIVAIAEILVLDDLRCEAAGYAPRPWQEALEQYQIIPASARAPLRKLYGEARH